MINQGTLEHLKNWKSKNHGIVIIKFYDQELEELMSDVDKSYPNQEDLSIVLQMITQNFIFLTQALQQKQYKIKHLIYPLEGGYSIYTGEVKERYYLVILAGENYPSGLLKNNGNSLIEKIEEDLREEKEENYFNDEIENEIKIPEKNGKYIPPKSPNYSRHGNSYRKGNARGGFINPD